MYNKPSKCSMNLWRNWQCICQGSRHNCWNFISKINFEARWIFFIDLLFSFFFWKSKQWLVKKLLFITYCSLSGSNECGEFNNKEDTIIVHLELNVLKSDLISRCNFKCCHSFVSHCSYISNMHIRLCSILHHVLIAGRWMLLKLYWAEQLSFSRCLVLVTLH